MTFPPHVCLESSKPRPIKQFFSNIMIVIKQVIAIIWVPDVMLIVTKRQRFIRPVEPFADLLLLRLTLRPSSQVSLFADCQAYWLHS
jgi:hypothetical protein